MVTVEEMLPHIALGGVYICEDVHGVDNEFITFVCSMVDRLNAYAREAPSAGQGLRFERPRDAAPGAIHSIHFYPYVVVIERNAREVDRLGAPRRGSEWI